MTATTGSGVLFFKPVYFFAKRTQYFGLFWPLLVLLGYFTLFLGSFSRPKNKTDKYEVWLGRASSIGDSLGTDWLKHFTIWRWIERSQLGFSLELSCLVIACCRCFGKSTLLSGPSCFGQVLDFDEKLLSILHFWSSDQLCFWTVFCTLLAERRLQWSNRYNLLLFDIFQLCGGCGGRR